MINKVHVSNNQRSEIKIPICRSPADAQLLHLDKIALVACPSEQLAFVLCFIHHSLYFVYTHTAYFSLYVWFHRNKLSSHLTEQIATGNFLWQSRRRSCSYFVDFTFTG